MPNKLCTDEELRNLKVYSSVSDALKDPFNVVALSLENLANPEHLRPILNLPNLQRLTIRNCNISAVESHFSRFPQLQQLLLFATTPVSGNGLQLEHLRNLYITNSLVSVPALKSISEVASLEELTLVDNRINLLPDTIQRLRNLWSLRFAKQNLLAFPTPLCELQSLEHLYLDNNGLFNLHDDLGRLKKLRELNLGNNQLRELPASILELKELNSLNLYANLFDEAPEFLSALPSLTFVGMEPEKLEQTAEWSFPHSNKTPRMEVSELHLNVKPDSKSYQQLNSDIEADGIELFAEYLHKNTREAVAIKTTDPEDYATTGNSRFGGFPDLEITELFPKSQNKYWSFLAQINLAEIAPYTNYLPKEGLLSFFVDDLANENMSASVIHFSGNLKNLVKISHGRDKAMAEGPDDYTQNPYKVAFKSAYSLPPELYREFTDKKYKETIKKYETGKLYNEGAVNLGHSINGHLMSDWEIENSPVKFRGGSSNWVPVS